jgi:hypothetical protein
MPQKERMGTSIHTLHMQHYLAYPVRSRLRNRRKWQLVVNYTVAHNWVHTVSSSKAVNLLPTLELKPYTMHRRVQLHIHLILQTS